MCYRNFTGCLFQPELNIILLWSHRRSGRQAFPNICLSPFNHHPWHLLCRNRPTQCSDTKLAPNNIAWRAYSFILMIWNSLPANLWTFVMTSASRTFAKHLKWPLPSPSDHETISSIRFDSNSLDTWSGINSCNYILTYGRQSNLTYICKYPVH